MADKGRTGLEDHYMELNTVECYKCMMYFLSYWQERACSFMNFTDSDLIHSDCTMYYFTAAYFYEFFSSPLIFKELTLLHSQKISDSLIW